MLLGDVQETPITDWSFVNDTPLCQIQVYAGFRPHAVNLNCVATEQGELFLLVLCSLQVYLAVSGILTVPQNWLSNWLLVVALPQTGRMQCQQVVPFHLTVSQHSMLYLMLLL
jgi:hypothetical protein